MTVLISIADQAESLRVARENLATQKAKVRGLKDAFTASIQSELDLEKEFAVQVEEAERQLKASGRAWWDQSDKTDKKPHQAIAIQAPDKLLISYDYDEDIALGYAIEKGIALKLDTIAFENYMAAVPRAMRPLWFHVTETPPEPKVTIASKIAPLTPIEPSTEPDQNLSADEQAVLESFK